MIKLIVKALFFILCLNVSLGASNGRSTYTKKNKTQQPHVQSSLASASARSRIVKNNDHIKTSPRSTASSTKKSQKYPPPSKNTRQFPKPIRDYIKAISDLCKIDSLEEQLQSMEIILKGLKDAVSFYKNHYPYYVSTGHMDVMMGVLKEDTRMQVFWDAIFKKRDRINIAWQFLLAHSLMYNSPEPAEENVVLLAYDWAESIYRGLYCLSTGSRTKERIIIY